MKHFVKLKLLDGQTLLPEGFLCWSLKFIRPKLRHVTAYFTGKVSYISELCNKANVQNLPLLDLLNRYM